MLTTSAFDGDYSGTYEGDVDVPGFSFEIPGPDFRVNSFFASIDGEAVTVTVPAIGAVDRPGTVSSTGQLSVAAGGTLGGLNVTVTYTGTLTTDVLGSVTGSGTWTAKIGEDEIGNGTWTNSHDADAPSSGGASQRISDVIPTPGGIDLSRFANPKTYSGVDINGELFFAGTNTDLSAIDDYASKFVAPQGLWKSDGTAEGTVLVGLSNGVPRNLTNVNGTLFFSDYFDFGKLWKSDGTAEGTVLVKDLGTTNDYLYLHDLTVVNGILFFTVDDLSSPGPITSEQWMSKGNAAGTVPVRDGAPFSSLDPNSLTNVGNELYFSAYDEVHGWELWKSEGTIEDSVLVQDISPGTRNVVDQSGFVTSFRGSYPSNLTNVDGTLYFSATDSAHGTELWKSGGNIEGAILVKDINPGSVTVYYNQGYESVQGTFPLSSNPSYLTEVGGVLFFSASDETHGMELWKSTGSEAGTLLVRDLNVQLLPPQYEVGGSYSSNPSQLTDLNGTLLFYAGDGSKWGLWASDGSDANVELLREVGAPYKMVTVGDTLVFAVYAPNPFEPQQPGTSELWSTDGTIAGTVLLKTFAGINSSIHHYGSSYSANNFASVNGTLFFSANDGITGEELWTSDGSPEGTVVYEDINQDDESSSPRSLMDVGGTLFFSADDGINGRGLWVGGDDLIARDGPSKFFFNSSADGAGFTFTYQIVNTSGTPLPSTTVQFHWGGTATGASPEDPPTAHELTYLFDINALDDGHGKPRNAPGLHTIRVHQSDLFVQQPTVASDRYLVMQVDPVDSSHPQGVVIETNETNNVKWLGLNDIALTSVDWNHRIEPNGSVVVNHMPGGGVIINYEVVGADLQVDVLARTFWSTSDNLADATVSGDPVFIERTAGSHTLQITANKLKNPPDDKSTHLIIVIDVLDKDQPNGVIVEAFENNNQKSLLADIHAITDRSVTVSTTGFGVEMSGVLPSFAGAELAAKFEPLRGALTIQQAATLCGVDYFDWYQTDIPPNNWTTRNALTNEVYPTPIQDPPPFPIVIDVSLPGFDEPFRIGPIAAPHPSGLYNGYDNSDDFTTFFSDAPTYGGLGIVDLFLAGQYDIFRTELVGVPHDVTIVNGVGRKTFFGEATGTVIIWETNTVSIDYTFKRQPDPETFPATKSGGIFAVGFDDEPLNTVPTIEPTGDLSVITGSDVSLAIIASDEDVGQTLSYQLEAGPIGATVDPVSGVFTWNAADNQTAGIYPITIVVADDGSPGLSSVVAFEIIVSDVLMSIATVNSDLAEGHHDSTVFTFTVTRAGDSSGAASVDYAVTGGGTDAADFGGALPSGTVNFSDGETVQVITINVTGDRTLESDEGFTVTLSNPTSGIALGTSTASGLILNDDHAPVFSSSSTTDIPENSTLVMNVIAIDEVVAEQIITYSITGGADAARFSITSDGMLTFNVAPDFELPSDAGGDNVYDLIVTATSDVDLTASQAIAVTVTPLNDNAPVFMSSATFQIAENLMNVGTTTATDADLPAQSVMYFISGGVDLGLFVITGDGTLSFQFVPDFEEPADSDGDNRYEVEITAHDGQGGVTVQSITITVADVNDESGAPQIALGGSAVTWINKHAAVTVLPLLTVGGSANLAGGTLTVSINAIGTAKKLLDVFRVPSFTNIGTSTGPHFANGRVTLQIQLNGDATAGGIQSFLRGFTFATKGKGFKTPTRTVTVNLAEVGGLSSSVSQTIHVRKKA